MAKTTKPPPPVPGSVCSTCLGTGTVEQTIVKTFVGIPYEEQQEVVIEPELSDGQGNILKPAKTETQTVILTRQEERDAVANGGPCPDCQGTGIVQ